MRLQYFVILCVYTILVYFCLLVMICSYVCALKSPTALHWVCPVSQNWMALLSRLPRWLQLEFNWRCTPYGSSLITLGQR